MSAKERLMGVIETIDESDAERVLNYVSATFIIRPKTWDDVEEDDPMEDEIEAFEAFRATAIS